MQAAASNSFFSGFFTMTLFGLGTIPAMMSFGFLVTRIMPNLKLLLYRISAVIIILLGMRTLLRGMVFNGWISPGRFW